MNGHELAGLLAPIAAVLWVLSRPHVSQALGLAAATGTATATATAVTTRARRHSRAPTAGAAPRITLPGSFDGLPAAPAGPAPRERATAGTGPNHPACRFYVEDGIRRLEALLAEHTEHG